MEPLRRPEVEYHFRRGMYDTPRKGYLKRGTSPSPSSGSSASYRTPPSPPILAPTPSAPPMMMLKPSAPPKMQVLRPMIPQKEHIKGERTERRRRRSRADCIKKIDKSLFGAKKFHENRDFVIIVDKSGSMNAPDSCSRNGQPNKRWGSARNAIKKIVHKACKYDDDGITLYLFSSDFEKYENVDSGRRVINIFNSITPKGSTNLTQVLNAAFAEHFGKANRKTKPTTILILTDGAPDCERSVISIIQRASNLCYSESELSLTFIQIGNDKGAKEFLTKLDDDLLCKYDIVDTIQEDCLQEKKLSFEELIYLSVMD
eukprot:TRINITY_DN1266_c1_g2_i1.p1 TRINITY_DN1266_c1_g2~~TRINITY_DN1266_c1_g2_i1.p1  ORF type:complete len:333 (+),score=65.58 TRINITY_DN1266_c1_g2_i1:52-999(+)